MLNRQSAILAKPIDATGRSLRKIAPLVLAALAVAVALFIAYGLVVPALAQNAHGDIPSLTLDSTTPGQLTITWAAPEQAPTDYRIRWANADLGFPSYSAANEAERGNEYPLGDVNTLTLSNLTPGDSYKVQIRSRYYNDDRSVHQSSGPWTQVMTQQVMNHPPGGAHRSDHVRHRARQPDAQLGRSPR